MRVSSPRHSRIYKAMTLFERFLHGQQKNVGDALAAVSRRHLCLTLSRLNQVLTNTLHPFPECRPDFRLYPQSEATP